MLDSKTEKLLTAGALTLATLFIALRFACLGTVPFLIDEPIFQEWALDLLAGGPVKFVGMGGSSLPVSYGSGAVWLYTIPHLLSSHPLNIVIFHTCIYASAFLFFYLAAKKAFGPSAAAWALLLASTSPFLFFFSRHTWDTTFFVPFTAVMLFAYASLEKRGTPWKPDWAGIWPFLVFTFFSALAINIQLAIGPFMLTLALGLLLWLWRRERRNPWAYAAVFLCGLAVILLCLPYLFAAMEFRKHYTAPASQLAVSRWGNFRHFWWDAMYAIFGVSVWKAKVFFEPVYPDFTAFTGSFWEKAYYVDLFGWLVKAAVIGSLAYPWWSLTRRGEKAGLLHWLAALGFAMVLLVFQYLNVPVQPHYFQSVWWVPFLALAALLGVLHGRAKATLIALVAGAALVNGSFLLHTLGYLRENGGIRGMVHGTGFAHTREITRALCLMAKSEGKKSVELDISAVMIGPPPFEYFARVSGECSGITLKVSKAAGKPGSYRLEYPAGSGTDARFDIQRVK